jgi:hypothetical protein
MFKLASDLIINLFHFGLLPLLDRNSEYVVYVTVEMNLDESGTA